MSDYTAKFDSHDESAVEGLDGFRSEDAGAEDATPVAHSTPETLETASEPMADALAEQAEEQDAPEGEGDGSGDAEEAQPNQVLAEAPKGKTFTFTHGDQKLEVGENFLVPVKIDGKVVPTPVSELVTNYSGKQAWDKRFNEVAVEKRALIQKAQEFEQKQGKSQQFLQDFHTKVAAGDAFGAFGALIEYSGMSGKVDPRTYVAELRNALFEQAQKMAQLSPEERRAQELREETDYFRNQLDRMRSEREAAQREEQSRVQFAQKLQSSGLSLDEYVGAEKYLLTHGTAHGIDANKLTPEAVLQHAHAVREYSTAIQALSDVDPKLAEDQKLQDEAVRLLRAYPGTTQQQLTEIFREAVGVERSKSISTKVAKSPVPTVATAKAKASTAQGKPAPGSKRSGALMLEGRELSPSDFEW